MGAMRGIATEAIPYGALVLCRAFRVSLADGSVANGTARPRPKWCGQGYDAGDCVQVDAVEGIGQRDLHALANGPIMDPKQIYLPAGKLSKAEAAARDRASWERIA